MNGASEIRRLRYLQALGVPTLVARRALPGAAPTRRLRLRNPPTASPTAGTTAAAPIGAEQPAAAPGSAAATRSATAIREALQPARPAQPQDPSSRRVARPAPQSQPNPAARPAAAKAAQDSVAATQRFSLAAMLCADRLWVEELEDALLAREQVQLVAAIARAMLHPQPLPAKPAVTQFTWPLHGNQQLDLGPEEAAASLQGFLQRQLEENSCVELLCLGDAAAQRLRGLRLPCALRRLPTTREVLADPALKRELWTALRA